MSEIEQPNVWATAELGAVVWGLWSGGADSPPVYPFVWSFIHSLIYSSSKYCLKWTAHPARWVWGYSGEQRVGSAGKTGTYQIITFVN